MTLTRYGFVTYGQARQWRQFEEQDDGEYVKWGEVRQEIERLTAERDKFEKFWKQTIEDSCEVERGIEALGIPLTDDYGALSLVEEVATRLAQAEQERARLRMALQQAIEILKPYCHSHPEDKGGYTMEEVAVEVMEQALSPNPVKESP